MQMVGGSKPVVRALNVCFTLRYNVTRLHYCKCSSSVLPDKFKKKQKNIFFRLFWLSRSPHQGAWASHRVGRIIKSMGRHLVSARNKQPLGFRILSVCVHFTVLLIKRSQTLSTSTNTTVIPPDSLLTLLRQLRRNKSNTPLPKRATSLSV